MANIISAIIFALLVAAGTLGVTSLAMYVLHRNPDDRDAQQRQRIEYAFFGIAAIVVMLLMWYAL
ncbi:membrane protein [Pseudidiomarina salinarum]|uniref:Membrane protein n=1 Tax=Pseudidiomarina salinarum TaxID=435908 RepID=A0A094L9N5_9GAMM|nr:hypothetical protein [Pseudidiomarina salinarum]KFZ31553.1 membrane protein [Pseudidiomarina salinarum]RUO70681.1 hypothetical protein CWI79_04310 [Pseudidiomarina salinarum]